MSNKDLLPYIHVFAGPGGGSQIYLRATDISSAGMISKLYVGTVRETRVLEGDGDAVPQWVTKAIEAFTAYVNPQTLKFLETAYRHIEYQLTGVGTSVWVTPKGLAHSQLVREGAE